MVAFAETLQRRLTNWPEKPADQLIHAIETYAAVQEMQTHCEHAIEIAVANEHFHHLPQLIRARFGLEDIATYVRKRIELLYSRLDLPSRCDALAEKQAMLLAEYEALVAKMAYAYGS